MSQDCWLLLLAGPNGAGKSTFAKRFLPTLIGNLPLINVDDLASAMSRTGPSADFAAARISIHRVEQLISDRQSLVIDGG